jgi:hypothetical protein
MQDYKHYDFETVTEYEARIANEVKKERSIIAMAAYSIAFIVLIALLVYSCTGAVIQTAENQERYYAKPLVLTEEQMVYRDFFKRHGSPAPDMMAVAVSQTKRPALMAALAVVESNGNPSAVGYSGDSLGAWQVQPKHWGPVSESPVQQALQAEKILEALVESRGSLRRGLIAYNAGHNSPPQSHRYAVKVLKLAGVQP